MKTKTTVLRLCWSFLMIAFGATAAVIVIAYHYPPPASYRLVSPAEWKAGMQVEQWCHQHPGDPDCQIEPLMPTNILVLPHY